MTQRGNSERESARVLAERLRNDISSGVFHPGEWLRQIDLQARYDAARFAVRQALAELSLSEVLEHVPNRGFRVVERSAQQRDELTDVRLCLEIPAAHLAIDKATHEDIEQISTAAMAFDTAIEIRPYAELRQLNHAFHRALVAACGNATMANLVNEMRERDLPGVWSNWASPARTRASSHDHLEMVAALRQRDKDRMTEVITRHLTRWRESG